MQSLFRNFSCFFQADLGDSRPTISYMKVAQRMTARMVAPYSGRVCEAISERPIAHTAWGQASADIFFHHFWRF
jgi:hypothetical protein